MGTSLSTGSGRASADFEIAELLELFVTEAPGLAERLEVAQPELNTAFLNQVHMQPKIAPVKIADAMNDFTPVEEPVPARDAPKPNEGVNIMQSLCETAVDMWAHPDKGYWQSAMSGVVALHPAGKAAVLASELNDIANQFEAGCICSATAELEIMYLKHRLC
jgi:hypothetical protein